MDGQEDSFVDEENVAHKKELITFIQSAGSATRLAKKDMIAVTQKLHRLSEKEPVKYFDQVKGPSSSFSRRVGFPEFYVLTSAIKFLPGNKLADLNDDVVKLWFRLAAEGLLSRRPPHARLFSKECRKLWKEAPEFLMRIFGFMKENEPTIYSLIIGSEVANFLSTEDVEYHHEFKTVLLENVLKALFTIRIPIPPQMLPFCARVVSYCADEDKFRKMMMPVMHRAVLRSAEANMRSLWILLKEISFDLSSCAGEFSQPLIKHLCTLSDVVRRETIRVLNTVVSKSTEFDAITGVYKQVYSQIIGPEGKKSGQDVRLAGLTCLGELSAHGGSRTTVVDKVGATCAGLLLDYMEQESHDETLMYAAKQLVKWLRRFKSNLPDRFHNFIKAKAFDPKVAPSVRCAYLLCLDSAFTNVRIADRLPTAILPKLLASVQQAIGQPTHSPIVFESVCASAVWLKYFVAKFRPLTEERIKSDLISNPVWAMLVGGTSASKRRPWFSERFLQTAPDFVLCQLASVLKVVLLELHPFIPTAEMSALRRTLILIALHPFYESVRQPALRSISSVVCESEMNMRFKHARLLLLELASCLSESDEDARVSKLIESAVQKAKATETAVKQTENVGLCVWNDASRSGPESEPPGLQNNQTRTHVVGAYVANLITVLFDCARINRDTTGNDVGPKESLTWKNYPVLEYWQNVLDTYLTTLHSASHPLIFIPIPTLWERLRRRLNLPNTCDQPDWCAFLEPKYLSNKWTEWVDFFITLPCLDQASRIALQRLFVWSCKGFGGALLGRVHTRLTCSAFASVSEREVHIMLTPSTQLYNREFLESLPRYQKSTTNVKRESKLYSYEVQLDILEAQKKREEMLKRGTLHEEAPLLDVLADQLTEKQLDAVRAELDKEALVRKRLLRLDAEARHLMNLTTTVLRMCYSPSIRSVEQLALAAGDLLLKICPKLSKMLVRLFTNPLVAPYTLSTQVACVSAVLLSCFSAEKFTPRPNAVHELHAPRIGWWSVRILGPVRLLQPSDITILQQVDSDNVRPGTIAANLRILEDALNDSALLTTCWSNQPIAAHTAKTLEFFVAQFPNREANASLLCTVLNPAFEFLLLASGWARPLLDELPSLPYPSLLQQTLDSTGFDDVIPASVQANWKWVQSKHAYDILSCWQIQMSSEALPVGFALHVLPFDDLFRLMRQVVEGCLYVRDATTDVELLPGEVEMEVDSPEAPEAHDEGHLNSARRLAQTSLEVLRTAARLFGEEWSVFDGDQAHLALADSAVQVLLTGLVSDTVGAREISVQCLQILTERIPTLIDQISVSRAACLSTESRNPTAEAAIEPEVSTTDERKPDVVEDTSELTEELKSGSEVAKKKKPSKNQRRKYKQAQLIAGLSKVHGDEQISKPYESPALWPSLPIWPQIQLRLWVARSDLAPEVATVAERLWVLLGFNTTCETGINHEASATPIMHLLDKPTMSELLSPMRLAQRLLLESTRPCVPVQKSVADAFALSLVCRTPEELAVILDQLIHMYRVMLYREPPVVDSMGRILVAESPDRWRERIGIALALARLPEAQNSVAVVCRLLRKGLSAAAGDSVPEVEHAAKVDSEEVADKAGPGRKADQWLLNMFRFLVPDGLNDRNQSVQSQMLQAGLRAVEIYGKAHLDQLFPIFDTFLNKAPNLAEFDAVRQSVLLLTGSLSCHLAADDPKVVNTFNRLLNTLSFPSDVVQQAVEDCLASLVKKLPEEQVAKTINRLMTTLLSSSNYAERHGAAHGVAGMARGLGIMSLKHYGIIDKLLPSIEDSKSAKKREGALLVIERLSLGMGRLFEPYVIRLISGLLNSFGDASPSVREAASNTARAVMAKLSAHGVRLILPALLRAIDDQQSWRTKAESVELLATMTHCAPKQLSACLPQIVPRLLEVLVDSQDRVKQAGMRALRQIGNVIRNPEVQVLVPLLTDCLQDPLTDKMPCLRALRDTCFVHVLDAPSLALILPVIQRAFDDRSTEARKTAAQIFGNLHSLARQEELQPYVGTILPPLKTCLLDAVPEVRSVAAGALGALVRGMGESCFTEILPWLIATLTSETSSVDRSGAAQGLAEVLGAMGIERLRAILPDLVQTAASDSKVQPHVRDGYLMLFVYLPAVFQNSFAEFIAPIIPTILKSLSDETEFLRETALRAAQQIVHMFAESSLELLLPELEQGMQDKNWRIRHSSVQLLGDLLYQLSGLSGKGTTKTQDEDDTFGTSEAHERLKAVMSTDRHDRILARLHMARSDPTLIVRQAAIHVWKVVVPNTSRTLREIMPVLIRLLLSTLGSSNREQQQLAARALGDVVRKLGERILPEVIPLLVLGLDSTDADQRRGVCTGLMEIMRNCPKEQLVNYADSLLVPIRRTLCDRLPEVRRSGARTFELLYGALGVRSLDGVLPDLLAQLDDPETNPFALDGLRQLLVVKGKAVMPYLVPKLTHPTVNVKAFAYLASVAGDALNRQLNRILPALLTTVSKLPTEPDPVEDLNHCAAVLICIYDASGVRCILNTLLNGLAGAPPNTAVGSGPPSANQSIISGTAIYRLACLRLLYAYLEASYDPTDDGTEVTTQQQPLSTPADQTNKSKNAKKNSRAEYSSGDEEDEEDDDDDDYSSEEMSDDEVDEDELDDDGDEDGYSNQSDEDDYDEDEESPDAKETIARVLREFYPLALRNICRLLSLRDSQTLTCTWNCLESLFKRWSPESVTTQVNDLRQGVRGAVSELHKTVTATRNNKPQDEFLPGFSDPSLPLVSLIKLYADCTLRGRADIKEPAAQGLSECISHASGASLQKCVVKVVGPLIRLLGERQTNVVRMAVVESLTALVKKCPQSARPFVTQLQATFMKCLGDSHRPMRILGGQGLASIVGITPKLDPLLIDLARVPVNTVLSNWPDDCIPGGVKPDASISSVGAAATALTLAGVATYPDTSLQALRLCLLGSAGRASLQALETVLTALTPIMCLIGNSAASMNPSDYPNDEDDVDYEDEDLAEPGLGLSNKSLTSSVRINPDAIRIVSSTCIGCSVHAAQSALMNKQPKPEPEDAALLQPARMLERLLFPRIAEEAHNHWTFNQSRAIALLLALKHAPDALVNKQTISAGITARLESLIIELSSHNQSAVSQLGYRCIGYFIGHVAEHFTIQYDVTGLMQQLSKGIRSDVLDIRLLITVVANHIAWRTNFSNEKPSVPDWLASFLTLTLLGTRDKASSVRQGSETALAILCRLGAPTHSEGQSSAALSQRIVNAADANSRASLDSMLQKLRKQTWFEVWRQGIPDLDNIVQF